MGALRATAGQASDGTEKEQIIKEIGYVPTVFYVCGDIDRAVDYCDRVHSELDDERRIVTKFNRVHFAVEREYHTPTLDKVGKAALRTELEAILNSPAVQGLSDQASVLDIAGLLKIAFADSVSDARLEASSVMLIEG
jgi:hypothetical protein